MARAPIDSPNTGPVESPDRSRRASRSRRPGRRSGGSGDDHRESGPVGRGNPDTGTFWWLGGKGTISQAYGNESSRYATGYHDGLDIEVPVGTKVAALTDGEVVFAGDAGADGYRVGIRTDNGRVYYYGHLSSIGVEVGQRVGRGQVVAQTGNTGRSTGPHVHFELNRDSDPTGESPIKFLERNTGGEVKGGYAGTGGSGTEAGGGVATELDWQELKAAYGYAAQFYKSSPELRRLIKEAERAQWTPEVFASRLMATKWYRTHTEAERKWVVLTTSDPEEAKRRLAETRSSMQQMYRQMGVPVPAKRLNALVRDAARFGWSPDEQQDAIAAEFDFDASKTYGGIAGQTLDEFRRMSRDYLVPLSDKTLDQWTTNVLRGEATPEDFASYAKDQAKSLFPELAPAIDKGLTVSQYLDPYREVAARELEMSPEDVDWFDNKWAQAVFQTDEKSGRRVMGLADWQRTLRTDKRFGWDKTTGARDAASQFATEIASMFGRQ